MISVSKTSPSRTLLTGSIDLKRCLAVILSIGCVILLGQPQTTRLEIVSDITIARLLSRKAAKRIAHGETVVIQVRNEYGLTSPPYNFTRFD